MQPSGMCLSLLSFRWVITAPSVSALHHDIIDVAVKFTCRFTDSVQSFLHPYRRVVASDATW